MLKPEKILEELDLKKNMVAAEFGCGSGFFAIALAKKLEDGLVYAIDVQQGPLSALSGAAASEGVKNIRIIRSDLEKSKGSTLSDSSLDLVLIPNILFQVEDKKAVISEANRVLKRGGKLLIIDWLPEKEGVPVKGRVSPEAIKNIAKEIGFELKKEFQPGPFHYGLIFEKP